MRYDKRPAGNWQRLMKYRKDMQINAFRQACCSADDQMGKLEAVYNVSGSTTLDALLREICAEDFLQYSSSHDRLSVEINGRQLAEVSSSGDIVWNADISPDTPVGLVIGSSPLHFVFRLDARRVNMKREPPESPSDYQIGAMQLDRRMYGGIGSLLGLVMALVLLNTVLEGFYFEHAVKWLICLFGVITGSIAGRILASRKWPSL